MQNEGAGVLRQKPAGTVGRSRDAGRDKLIQEAALALLSELGPEAVSMEAVAARAGVGKATIYRRWSTLADLIADATDTLVFPAVSNRDHPGLLRDDLIDSLVDATGCLDPHRQRLIATVLEASLRGTNSVAGLRTRFIQCVRTAMEGAIERAVSRGELEVDNPNAGGLGGESVLLAVAVGLMVNFPHITGRPLGLSEFERIVDEALLPLLNRAR
ncbi:TetR/AcrR family transcriptional regulator [Rhizobium sp. C4]|uniref:TetR/AcrR family transcriptional regulator n=1 Tax=Rhizobium sp. C4 TaxID=1349800 RepID=UPI001E32DB33|nr:TetR/AcrR family transcriptional regulator [Rhizobium sp. C4]MCD2174984.1 TetR/AcrR family transcriptional regulator [Rhizobium sp. C4]